MEWEVQALHAEFEELREWVASGELPQATRAELQRHVEILALPQARAFFGAQEHPQVLDAVRTLLVAKIAGEANKVDARLGRFAAVQSRRQSLRANAMTVAVVVVIAGMIVAGYQFYRANYPPTADTAALPVAK